MARLGWDHHNPRGMQPAGRGILQVKRGSFKKF